MTRENAILPGVKDGQQGFDAFEDGDEEDDQDDTAEVEDDG